MKSLVLLIPLGLMVEGADAQDPPADPPIASEQTVTLRLQQPQARITVEQLGQVPCAQNVAGYSTTPSIVVNDPGTVFVDQFGRLVQLRGGRTVVIPSDPFIALPTVIDTGRPFVLRAGRERFRQVIRTGPFGRRVVVRQRSSRPAVNIGGQIIIN